MILWQVLDRLNRFRKKVLRKKVEWHNLRRVTPVSDIYGLDRGQSIDRYYIGDFLSGNSEHIRGSVLELLGNHYTKLYGRQKVIKSDVLDIDEDNRNATIVADLTKADIIKDETYDCFILTQTLQFIYDLDSAVYHSQRILKRGGVLLVSLPSVSRIDCIAGVDGDFWRFTKASAEKLFERYFGKENVSVQAYGNVLADISFLMGLATDELTREELDYNDANFPLIICVRAIKGK